jgi:hypothetical protein
VVSDYGRNDINTIHDKKYPNIEIQQIAPTDEIREVGTITGKQKKSTNMDAGANAGLKSGFRLPFIKGEAGADASFRKQSDSESLATSTYPNLIVISTGGSSGHDAMWDFKQGKGIGWKGQYNLNIAFKIREPIEDIKSQNYAYHVVFDIAINGKKGKFEKNGPVPNSSPMEFIY